MPYFCNCGGGSLNTGYPSVMRVIAQAKLLIFVPIVDASGTVTKIAKDATLDAAYFNAKLIEGEELSRWYPVGPFVNVAETKEDPTYEEYSDGSRALVREGRRNFTGQLLGFGAKYLDAINTLACNDIGVFAVDDCGNLVGRIGSDGDLYPVQVQRSNLHGKLMKRTDSEAGKIQVSFDVSMLEKDSNLRQVNASQISGIDLLSLRGLRNVQVSGTSATTTAFDITLAAVYDGWPNSGTNTLAEALSGFVQADFTLYNVTTASTVTISGVTESPDGTYELAYTAQSSGDVLRVRSNKHPWWFEATATIP